MAEICCPQCGYSLETAGSVLTTCPRCESTVDVEAAKSVPSSPARNLSGSSSPAIDVAGLIRRVLAKQQPGEDFDAALERIVQTEYPENREKIVMTTNRLLNSWQQRFALSRAEAAQQLAQSTAQLTVLSDIDLQKGTIKLASHDRQQLQEQIEKAFREGKPLPIIRMEDLKPENRQQLLQLVEKALREGSPIIAGPEKVELIDIQGMEKLPPKFKLQIQQQIEEAVREGKPIPTEITVSPLMLGKISPRKVLILAALLLGWLLYFLWLR